ncbi:MAG TPA: phosphatidylglycerophosphatase A [Pyrinomonadaceae bacterium]|nr:phosphatidylglycerophosphatase A [Pyrinomonadaceae bacterium]
MPDYDELIHTSAAIELQELAKEEIKEKNLVDYFSLAVTTFGVGYLPLAPGTWGSMVGVAIYLLFRSIEANLSANFGLKGWTDAQITAWIHVGNLLIFLPFCLLGIWAANRATKLFKHKDPSQAVVDEVMGQLIVYLFVPFDISWKLILAGFLLFRLFDIWKPYPIDSLQNLPAGIGVCADDILAGVYGGVCLSLIYAVAISL